MKEEDPRRRSDVYGAAANSSEEKGSGNGGTGSILLLPSEDKNILPELMGAGIEEYNLLTTKCIGQTTAISFIIAPGLADVCIHYVRPYPIMVPRNKYNIPLCWMARGRVIRVRPGLQS